MNVSSPDTLKLGWMLKKQIQIIRQFEADVCENPWTKIKIEEECNQRDVVGRVVIAESDSEFKTPFGFILYRIAEDHLDILRLAVSPAHHRRGIGRMLTNKIKGSITPSSKRRSVCITPMKPKKAYADAMNAFLNAMGFDPEATPPRWIGPPAAVPAETT